MSGFRFELAVYALVVSVIDGDGRYKMHNLSTRYGPLIPSGQSDELDLGFHIASEDESVLRRGSMSCSHAPQGAGGSLNCDFLDPIPPGD